MKECRVKWSSFCEIFPSRSIEFRKKVSTTIYFIEDDDGNYSIEERVNFIGASIACILFIPFLLFVIVWAGVREVPDFVMDTIRGISNRNCRKDTCYHGVESTNKLIEILNHKG